MWLLYLLSILSFESVVCVGFIPAEQIRPKPIYKWSGVLDATKFGPCCAALELTSLPRLEMSVTGEEDCLYLNVYTPKEPGQQISKRSLAIMLFIHGGGFMGGCGDIFEPDFLVENEIILVVPNYRLSIFGYLSTEDLECPGNWAIKDLIAALKWVNINIKQFGGDPNRVTIFGQSSGAVMTNAIVLSPKAQGLIHRAILMSGSMLSFWAFQMDPRKVAFDVGIALGIETNSSRVLMEKLRKIDKNDLLNSQLPVILANIITTVTKGLPFTPTIEPLHRDAVLSNEFPYYLLERGDFNRIPIMIGVTSMEALFYKGVIDIVKPFLSILDISPGLWIRITQDNRNKTIVGNKIKSYLLPSTGYGRAGDKDLLELASQDAYLRPAHKLSVLAAKYSPVYFYQFSYEGQLGLEVQAMFSGVTEKVVKGVAHSEDLAYLFHTKGIRRNKEDMQMTKKMTKIYTNFAKTGNPTPEVDSLLDNITWPAVSAEKFPYVKLDEDFRVINNNFDEENFQFWEGLYQAYAQKPYKVY